MYERFEEIMKAYNLNIKDMAIICKLTPQALSAMKKNDSTPNGIAFMNIANQFKQINLRWLLTGEGEMLVKKESTYRENVLEAATKTQDPEGVYGTTNEALNNLMAVYRRLVELENENKLLRERLNEYLK